MKSKRHFNVTTVRGALVAIAALPWLGIAFAPAQETGPPASKSPTRAENPASASAAKPSVAASPEQPQINPQELGRLTKAADKVLNRIQKEENDLYLRVNYFEKPDRLNPNSYASKEEVAQWQGMLQQLKEKHDLVAKLYAELGKDLDAELHSAGGNVEVVAHFRKFIVDGFPWATIEKKNNLIAEFIDEHAKLLMFYEKNWGTWSSSSNPGKPEFTSGSAANIYKRLRDQILDTSQEIEKEYREMSE
jgi:type IV secretory pathway VirB10-like protein